MEGVDPQVKEPVENSKERMTETEPEANISEKKPLVQFVREKATVISTAVAKRANRVAQFLKDHRGAIATGAVTVVGAIAYVASAQENNQLREENAQLTADNEALLKENETEHAVNDLLAARVNSLEGLCEEKDAHFKEAISDGLRHGSSLAGKHMADRKEYLSGK